MQELNAEKDATLWQRFVDTGDRQALAELLDQHVGRLRQIAFRVTRSDADADDAVQMAVERLLGFNQEQRSQVRSIRTWLAGLVMNCSRHVIEKETRLRARHQRAQQLSNQEPVPSPEEAIEGDAHQALLKLVDETLQELPDKYQDTIILHYIEGMQFKDVGEALGRSEEAVKKQAQRGIKKMRGILERRGVAVASAALLACLGELHAEAPVTPAVQQLILNLQNGTPIITIGATTVQTITWVSLAMKAVAILCAVAVLSFTIVAVQDDSNEENSDQIVLTPKTQVEQKPKVDPVFARKKIYATWDLIDHKTDLIPSPNVTLGKVLPDMGQIYHLNAPDERNVSMLALKRMFKGTDTFHVHYYYQTTERHPRPRVGVSFVTINMMLPDFAWNRPSTEEVELAGNTAGWQDVEIIGKPIEENQQLYYQVLIKVNQKVASTMEFPRRQTFMLMLSQLSGLRAEIKDLRMKLVGHEF